jgi:predicted Zn finger-like uncharacterized protein
MTVRCPRCSTRYRLPPRSTLGRNPTYRCSRCRHVFAPDEEAEAPAVEALDEYTVGDDEVDDDAPAFTIEHRPDAASDGEQSPPPRRNRRDEPSGPRSSPARFAVRSAVLVTLVYGVLSIYLHTHPAEARAIFGRIPLIGDELRDTRLHPGHIQLADVRGDFKRVHGDRLVFVVTGTAINNAPVPVAGIQVESRISGTEERRQVVY